MGDGWGSKWSSRLLPCLCGNSGAKDTHGGLLVRVHLAFLCVTVLSLEDQYPLRDEACLKQKGMVSTLTPTMLFTTFVTSPHLEVEAAVILRV